VSRGLKKKLEKSLFCHFSGAGSPDGGYQRDAGGCLWESEQAHFVKSPL
jgi:sugar lactone lactonase YvrE